MAHPLDSAGSAYDDVLNDLSTAGSVFSAQQQIQQQQIQQQQQQIQQLQQQLSQQNQQNMQNTQNTQNMLSSEQTLRKAVTASGPTSAYSHHANMNGANPRSSMTQSMILPSTSSNVIANPLNSMTASFNPSQLQFTASQADISSALTPVGQSSGAGRCP